MTIRPRHYARLLVEGTSTDVLATRIDSIASLAAVDQQLAELMVLPSTQDIVTKILVEAGVDELTRSIVTELGITGKLSWLPAIGRSVERLVAANGQPAVAHVRVARPDVVSDDDVTRALKSTLGSIGTVRTRIVPHQLGGITVQVADQRLDAGLATKLVTLRQALRDSSRENPRDSSRAQSRERIFV